VIDYCDVSGNQAANGGGLCLNLGDQYARSFVANCRITANRAAWGAGVYSGSFRTASREILVNCLIQGNRESGAGSDGIAIYKGQSDSFYLVNCTVVDNLNTLDSAKRGVYADVGNWAPSYLTFVNSIVSSNNGIYARSGVPADTWGSHIRLQRTAIAETVFSQTFNSVPSSTNTFVGALTFSNSCYHSLNDAGTQTQNIELNLEGDPGFIGKGRYPYQLTRTSPSLNNALTRTAGSGDTAYTYVDVNSSGSYDALLDVIVAGMPPAPTGHYVYRHDVTVLDAVLSGMNLNSIRPSRVIERLLDRGAYEFVPPAGTVVTFR
jgi:hypothetical protein